jgi:hypothetical protein
MPKKSSSSTDSDLTTETAEKVFGWRSVHKHDGKLVGKKPDKLGRWRTANVPDYAKDTVQSFTIDERMKQLGCSELYQKELARETTAAKLPEGWATPEQRCKAALKALRK